MLPKFYFLIFVLSERTLHRKDVDFSDTMVIKDKG